MTSHLNWNNTCYYLLWRHTEIETKQVNICCDVTLKLKQNKLTFVVTKHFGSWRHTEIETIQVNICCDVTEIETNIVNICCDVTLWLMTSHWNWNKTCWHFCDVTLWLMTSHFDSWRHTEMKKKLLWAVAYFDQRMHAFAWSKTIKNVWKWWKKLM